MELWLMFGVLSLWMVIATATPPQRICLPEKSGNDSIGSSGTDLPGPPLNAVADAYYQGLRVNWTAASVTGGLPVNYMVKFDCNTNEIFQCNEHCLNFSVPCLDVQDDIQLVKFAHVPGKSYSCVVLLHDKDSPVVENVLYRASVIAVNELGSVSNGNLWKIRSEDYEFNNIIISPPQNVQATDVNGYGLKITFERGKYWYTVLYTVIYRVRLTVLDGKGTVVHQKYINLSPEKYAKTLYLPAVVGLKSFTKYKVQVQVQIKSTFFDSATDYSLPGFVTVRTNKENLNIDT